MGSVYSKGQQLLNNQNGNNEIHHYQDSFTEKLDSVTLSSKDINHENGGDDGMEFLKELMNERSTENFYEEKQTKLHPMIALGLGSVFVLNLGMILSLPPVLRGKGAPYLPTFSKKLQQMFEPLSSSKKQYQTFVDLGSGDGRVVFAAARQKHLFQNKCIGYEINPVLHGWAMLRRILQGYKYWSKTEFFIKDLWKVDLRNVDVVAVYGLQPIMKDLGIKLKNELRPGSVVISNVFTIPGWKADTKLRNIHNDGLHYYTVPHSYQKCDDNRKMKM